MKGSRYGRFLGDDLFSLPAVVLKLVLKIASKMQLSVGKLLEEIKGCATKTITAIPPGQ